MSSLNAASFGRDNAKLNVNCYTASPLLFKAIPCIDCIQLLKLNWDCHIVKFQLKVYILLSTIYRNSIWPCVHYNWRYPLYQPLKGSEYRRAACSSKEFLFQWAFALATPLYKSEQLPYGPHSRTHCQGSIWI